jgi:5,10-methylenetetrahydromethanopterin reductase
MERLGVNLSHERGASNLRTVVDTAKFADENGIESIWPAENYYYRDIFTTAALLAHITKNVKIGLGVALVYPRNPVLTAMGVASLLELADPREILCGLGVGRRVRMEGEIGVPWTPSPETVQEHATIVRKLVAGERVNFDGSVYHISNVALELPLDNRRARIYIAAGGPKMLKVAGQIADGVLLYNSASAGYIKWAIGQIHEAAKEAGRDPADIDIGAVLHCAVSDEDPRWAYDALKPALVHTLSRPGFGELILTNSDMDTGILEEIRQFYCMERGRRDSEGAKKLITDDLVKQLELAGTSREVSHKLEQCRRAGLQLPVVCGVHEENHIDCIKACLR